MRQQRTPALLHLPKLEKSFPSQGRAEQRTWRACQACGNVQNDKPFTRRVYVCMYVCERGLYSHPHLLRNGIHFPSGQSLTGSFPIPSTAGLMVFRLQAGNFSLSRNNPLHWQMSGIWQPLPLLRLCLTWMALASQGPLGEVVRDLGQFLLS